MKYQWQETERAAHDGEIPVADAINLLADRRQSFWFANADGKADECAALTQALDRLYVLKRRHLGLTSRHG